MTTDILAAIRDSAEHYLASEQHPSRIRQLRAEQRTYCREHWRSIADLGWLSALAPEAAEGLGLGLPAAANIAEALGRHRAPEPYIAAAVQPIFALAGLAPNQETDTLIRQLASGERVAALAWQETAGQLDAGECNTAMRDGKLHGEKRFVLPDDVDGWLLTFQEGSRLHLAWVPSDAPGIEQVSQPCADGGNVVHLKLHGVAADSITRLPHGDVAAAINRANDMARIAQGAELVGIGRKLMEMTIEHLTTRQQFGQPIGNFQALQHRAVDAMIQLELADAALNEGLDQLEHEPDALPAWASRIKARCAHAAMIIARSAIQFHGAMGYTDESDVTLYFKRVLFLSGWLGNPSRHRDRYLSLQSLATDDPTAGPTAEREFPRDADWEAMPEHEFRSMLREFFKQRYPAGLRNIPRRVRWHEIRDWYMTLSKQGWVAPGWPKEYGGMGLSPARLLAFVEEQERYGVARAPDMGIVMIGPLLMRYGTQEQKQYYLPRILAGEHVWCQGYSEPSAGSDLASLRTEAKLEGDSFVVNGQKIWTTLAQDATHMFALVRTAKTGKKQEGISFILIDLSTPGITVRPIDDIGGHAEFCEVFFDNVRVPAENLVGELHKGWSVAKALLGFERIFLGSPKQCRFALQQLTELALHRSLFEDDVFRARYAELMLDVEDLASLYTHFADYVKRGEPLPDSVSMLKVWSADTYQRVSFFMAECADEHGGTSLTTDFNESGTDVPALVYFSIPSSIYGGSSEIQRNILANRVLGLGRK